jgi:hypothetical protein
MFIRPETKTDESYVVKSWLRSGERAWLTRRWVPASWKHWCLGKEPMRRAVYNREISKLIRDRGRTLVVSPLDDPGFLIAWACPEYCFTKHTYRRNGLATALRAALAG